MIPAERAHLHVAAKSHPGQTRATNEDRYAVAAFRLSSDKPLPVVFAVVSDGIGGHLAGEVAAETAVEILTQSIAASDGTQPLLTFKEAFARANQSIASQAASDPEKHGMGATCACALVISDRLYIAYAGDSRIFLLRGEKIQQISIDHTWVQDAVKAGLISPEQARSHPNAHVIRRYLGSTEPSEPDLRLLLHPGESDAQAEANQGFPLAPGDTILLCSDGLTDLVEPEEIKSALLTKPLDNALDDLVNLANQRGGYDNITVVALKAPAATMPLKRIPSAPYAASPPAPAPTPPTRKFKWPCLLIALGVLILLLIIGAVSAYFLLHA